MNKPLRVSYSAISTYNLCSEKYRIEYIDKIMTKEIPTPFVIGNAIDDISSFIFDSMKKESEKVVTKQESLEKLRTSFEWYKNTKDEKDALIHVPTTDRITFPKSEIDLSLLHVEDYTLIQVYAHDNGIRLDASIDDIEAFFDAIQGMSMEELPEPSLGEYLLYKQIVYISIVRKLEIIVDYMYDWIIENVDYVVSTQREIKVEDDDGNTYVGYIDVELKLKNEDSIRTIDVKTARDPKRFYPDNCIEDSLQLHLYANWSNLDVGYLVFSKNIAKRVDTRNRNMVRFVIGRVSEEGITDALDYMNETISNIKSEIYEPNWDACMTYGRCTHYESCREKYGFN